MLTIRHKKTEIIACRWKEKYRQRKISQRHWTNAALKNKQFDIWGSNKLSKYNIGIRNKSALNETHFVIFW